MLFERLFPFRFENCGDESLVIRVDDDDFVVPSGACLSSLGDAIYLTSRGDAAMRAFPVPPAEPHRRQLRRAVLPVSHRARATLASEILRRATAEVF